MPGAFDIFVGQFPKHFQKELYSSQDMDARKGKFSPFQEKDL